MSMSNYFHEDILWNIFIRLPAKQLAQMRCISKPFNHLLSHPSFIKSHLDHSVHKKDQVFLLFNSKEDFAIHSSASTYLQFTNSIKLPVNMMRRPHTVTSTLAGSVNGLICYENFSVEDNDILIWNPSLSALITLPPYTNSRCICKVFLKFGFDPKNNDYKVVKFTFCNSIITQVSLDVIYNPPKVEVYSMRKGCWKSITERFPSHVSYIFEQDPTCAGALDGHLHWLVDIGHRRVKQKIVAFDLDGETFSEISLPPDLDMVLYPKEVVLLVVDGKLCVMSWNVGGFKCDVWVMNEYRVYESWTKYHVLLFDCPLRTPIGFISRSEFLFEDYYGHLALSDLESATVELLNVEFHKGTSICKYVDSLVWVVPDKRGINIFKKGKTSGCRWLPFPHRGSCFGRINEKKGNRQKELSSRA